MFTMLHKMALTLRYVDKNPTVWPFKWELELSSAFLRDRLFILLFKMSFTFEDGLKIVPVMP